MRGVCGADGGVGCRDLDVSCSFGVFDSVLMANSGFREVEQSAHWTCVCGNICHAALLPLLGQHEGTSAHGVTLLICAVEAVSGHGRMGRRAPCQDQE